MSTTVGQYLRRAREERALSIEQAASATHIKPHYLRSLEADKLDAMPSMAHARGFIRAYGGYLGLDADELLRVLDNRPLPAMPVETPVQGAFPAQPAAPLHTGSDAGEIAAIFLDLGEQLRSRREMLGLSLEDVERHTHLRGHYLRALESGDLDGLPSPVQGRGMLSNYAVFLGMNPEPLLLRFAEGLQARLAVRQAAEQPVKAAARRRRSRAPRWLRRLLSADILIGGVLTVVLGLFVIWVSLRVFATTTEETTPTPTAPSIAEVLLATASPTPPATAESTPTVTLPALVAPPTQPLATDPETGELATPGQGLQVTINVRQRVWMRVRVDGEVKFDGRVIPGAAYPFNGNATIEVNTGNGAALQIFLNGIDQGLLGGPGEVVNRMFSPAGQITATPSITPTPTETVPATPAPPAATQLPLSSPPALP